MTFRYGTVPGNERELTVNDMRNILKYVCGIAAGALMFAASGCGPKEGKEQILGPEETVAAFYGAVATGDFDAACGLCDTVTMSTYLEMNRAEWERLMQEDSTVARIAAGMLSAAAIEFSDVEKEGDRRVVHYSIDAAMGMKKNKTATVKKEEGVWKVERIADVH